MVETLLVQLRRNWEARFLDPVLIQTLRKMPVFDLDSIKTTA